MAKRLSTWVVFGAAISLAAPFSWALGADLETVATHEAVGLYAYAPERAGDCPVRYRRRGDEAWKPALDLWYDARSRECRGSIVGLEAGVRYEAEVTTGKDQVRPVGFTTVPNRRPVARVVAVP